MMDEADRLAEYRICQLRGHQPSGYVTASIPPKQRCRWCETYYWTETILREHGAPVSSDRVSSFTRADG